jgi:hypothetical protein
MLVCNPAACRGARDGARERMCVDRYDDQHGGGTWMHFPTFRAITIAQN